MADANVVQRTRTCTRCLIEKPATLEFFPPHHMGKHGLHSWCIQCKRAIDAERRKRPDQQARQQAWRDGNKAKVRGYNEGYRKTYKSTADVAAWRIKNLERARAQARDNARKRRRNDMALRLKERLRARIASMVKDKCSRKTEELLGFTIAEFRVHIERQFTKGMSWEALATGAIHIDHILPVSSFNITSVDDPDFKLCWALSNLRPMWKRDNLTKGSRRVTLL